jgi:hypothetical protein
MVAAIVGTAALACAVLTWRATHNRAAELLR